MRKQLPLILAIAGAAFVFVLWRQREAKRRQQRLIESLPSQAELVPQEWIEATPEGYTVPGTTSAPFDILT